MSADQSGRSRSTSTGDQMSGDSHQSVPYPPLYAFCAEQLPDDWREMSSASVALAILTAATDPAAPVRELTCPHGWAVVEGQGCPTGSGCNEAERVPPPDLTPLEVATLYPETLPNGGDPTYGYRVCNCGRYSQETQGLCACGRQR